LIYREENCNDFFYNAEAAVYLTQRFDVSGFAACVAKSYENCKDNILHVIGKGDEYRK